MKNTSKKVATYKTPNGYILYTQDITSKEVEKAINVNVAWKNGTKESPLNGGIAYFIGVFDLADVEKANEINSKRGKLVIDLVNDQAKQESKKQAEMQKKITEIDKLRKKVESSKKSLDKKRTKAYEDKELQARLKNALTIWRGSWGDMTDEQIKESLRQRILEDFQRDYKEFEEIDLKLGKLNAEFFDLYGCYA